MKQTNSERIKKVFNRKILLGASSLLVCVLLIAICSFVPFIIDPRRWQTTEFLTDELIITAIVIFSMVSAMFIGQASNAQNENSKIAKARAKFLELVKEIVDLFGFSQWVKKVLQPRDIRAIKERKVRALGVEDLSVLDLENNEIKSLEETPQKYNDRFYKGLTKQQVQGILAIKNDKIKIALVEPEYYLSVNNLIDNRTISERSGKEGIVKGLYLTRSIVFKVILGIVTAMIFASLMRDLTASQDIGIAFQKFFSRLWAMVSSVFMGYLVGCQINDIDAEYIEMRITVQKMYLQDKDFKPMTQQEAARQEFVDRVKKEQVMKLDNKSNQIEMKG